MTYKTNNKELNKRIQNAIKNKRANCFGTALYLAGVLDKDQDAVGFFENHVKKMKRISYPEINALVIMMGKFDIGNPPISKELEVHAGLITFLNPLKITHRNGAAVELKQNDLLEHVIKKYHVSSLLYYKKFLS
jgi:hypothetical protein